VLACSVDVLVQQLLGRPGLNGDDRDAVRNDVVQLARDPRALVSDRGAREISGLLVGPAQLQRAPPDQPAGGPGPAGEEQQDRGVARVRSQS
jgi:hypothetical protein